MKKVFLSNCCPTLTLLGQGPVALLGKGFLGDGSNRNAHGMLMIIRCATSVVLLYNALVIFTRLGFVHGRSLKIGASRALIIGFPKQARNVGAGLRTVGGTVTHLPLMSGIAFSNTIPNRRITAFLSGEQGDSTLGRGHLCRVLMYSPSCVSTCKLRLITKHKFSRSCKSSIGGLIIGRSTIHGLKVTSGRRTLNRRVRIRYASTPVRVVKIIGSCRRRTLGGGCAPVVLVRGSGVN